MSSPQDNGGIDFNGLFGDFQSEEKARIKDRRILHNKMKYKAVNIPYTDDDPMNVKNTSVKNGIGTLGAIGIALATGLPLAGVAGMMLWNQQKPSPSVMTQPVQTNQPAPMQPDGEFDYVEYSPAANGEPEKIINRMRHRWHGGVLERKLPDGTWERVK